MRAEAVAAADDDGSGTAALLEGGAHVEVEGLAEGAGLFGAVEDGDGGAGGRDGAQQVLGGEGTEEVHLHEAEALAFFVEVLDGLFDDFAGGAHADDDAVGFGIAHVLEDVVGTAGDGGHFLHVGFDDFGHVVMELVGGLDALEVDVGVLGRAAQSRMVGIHAAFAELGDLVPGNQLADVFVVDDFDFLDFVGGAEAVEEVQDRHAGLEGGQVGDEGQIHAFLHGTGAQHGEAGLATGHDVLVVAEDGEGLGGQGAGGNMEDAGQELAGNLVHVRDHEQQALGGREGAGQGAGGEHAVDSASGAGLGLHLANGDSLAHEVFDALGSHFIDDFAHDRGRRDGVDSCGVGQRVGNPCGCVVAVHGFHLGHVYLLKGAEKKRACLAGRLPAAPKKKGEKRHALPW